MFQKRGNKWEPISGISTERRISGQAPNYDEILAYK